MSLNRACPDAPLPVLADSAAVLGTAWIGAGAVLAQGTIVRSHQEAVSIGNHSAVLENSSVVGTSDHPVAIGQRTVFGHRTGWRHHLEPPRQKRSSSSSHREHQS
jgi:carbonic anhydrase/acetyltransferase-like protein (isoleucine patch superfamily)